MTTHIGSEGSVNVGANAVAEVTSFKVTEQTNLVPDGALGDTWETHKAGTKSWQGELTCNYDPSDTNGQVALANGASVTLNLYPEGDDTSDNFMTGTATIESIETNVGGNDEITSATFTFKGNGALTHDTVSA